MRGTNRLTAVMAGTMGMMALSNRNTFKAANKARRQGEDAQDRADEAYDLAQGLAVSGDLQRLGNDWVSDFLAGLAAGGHIVSIEPGAFAAAPVTVPRIDLTESAAIAPNQHPPAVNAYDGNGNLKNPEAAMDGELFGTGFALTHANVRAALMGLASRGQHPSPFQISQVFRVFAGLDQVLRSIPTPSMPDGLSLDDYASSWRRFLGRSESGPAVPRGVLFSITEDTGSVAATTTEGVYVSIPVPRNACAVGESLRARVELWCATAYQTDTLTANIRVGTTGAVILTSGAVDPGNSGDGIGLDLLLTRRKDDAAGNAVYAVSGLARGGGQVPFKTFSVSAAADFALGVTGQWSSNNVANVSTCTVAVLEKL